MPAPCPKCGGIKIEPGEPGLLYWLAEFFGYRLRICGRCRGYRLFKISEQRRSRSTHRPHTQTSRESEPEAAENAAPADQAAANPPTAADARRKGNLDLCPWCGSAEIRRSHRTWWERRRGKPPMYRCRDCDHRFPREEDD